MKKLYLYLIVGLFLLSFASASLGSFKQSECVPIRVLANCSVVNMTEITNGGYTEYINAPMSFVGGQTFNYTYCNTSKLGTYTYSWNNPCVDCSQDNCGNSFEITPQGDKNPLGLTFILIGAVYAIGLAGFFFKNEIVTIIGGMAMMILGVYMIIYGIDVYRNFMTNAFSYFTTGLGAFFAISAAMSLIQDSE